MYVPDDTMGTRLAADEEILTDDFQNKKIESGNQQPKAIWQKSKLSGQRFDGQDTIFRSLVIYIFIQKSMQGLQIAGR
ncbi:hypothetical protein BDDG_04787 [Blastomyces dermatitidis ATCC 18188]|uniref:Uncharacterized protein n=1 Tax=Ajellomyces dermatitidis (strain ATCC 18188 / CBS 674.68) TaxID=653446 RepID=F2TF31_AJEDA|nr:hypothetical protein BDDG_04787 [Blastomyces dermatitidis ATCC 18188]